MNKKFYRKVNALAVKYGLNITPEQISVKINCTGREQFEAVFDAVSRSGSYHVDTFRYDYTIRLFDKADWQEWQESEQKKQKLVDFFFHRLRENGRDQTEAKEAEYRYALEIGAVAEYNAIYA